MRVTERFALPQVERLSIKVAVILCAALCTVFVTQPAAGQRATEGVVGDKSQHDGVSGDTELLEQDGREGLVDGQACNSCTYLDEEPPVGSGVAWDSVGAYEGCYDDASEQQFEDSDDCSIIHEGNEENYSACYESAQSSYDSAVSECDSM